MNMKKTAYWILKTYAWTITQTASCTILLDLNEFSKRVIEVNGLIMSSKKGTRLITALKWQRRS